MATNESYIADIQLGSNLCYTTYLHCFLEAVLYTWPPSWNQRSIYSPCYFLLCHQLNVKIWTLRQWFYWWEIFIILENLKKKYSVTNSLDLEKHSPKKTIKRIATIAYDMKGCLRFSTSTFWILPILATYTYGLLPLAQHHKTEGKKKHAARRQLLLFYPHRCQIWSQVLVLLSIG